MVLKKDMITMKEKNSPGKPVTPIVPTLVDNNDWNQDSIVPVTPLSYQKNVHLGGTQTSKFPQMMEQLEAENLEQL